MSVKLRWQHLLCHIGSPLDQVSQGSLVECFLLMSHCFQPPCYIVLEGKVLFWNWVHRDRMLDIAATPRLLNFDTWLMSGPQDAAFKAYA